MSNNYILFLSPTLSSSSNESAIWAPPMAISWFLVHWVKSRPDFFTKKPFLWFLLSLFINYVAISTFYLRDKSFNENRNHCQYTIGTALTKLHRIHNLTSTQWRRRRRPKTPSNAMRAIHASLAVWSRLVQMRPARGFPCPNDPSRDAWLSCTSMCDDHQGSA